MAENGPLTLETQADSPPIPSIAALFLVKFDHRKGYVVAWERSIASVQVEGVVEFKSLPSGLHNVEEDLVYFIQDEYAGISAFVNQKDEESARNARMLAVGVLVPLEHGRMGKSWRHADGLKELARTETQSDNTNALEGYWDKYRLDDDTRPESPPTSATDIEIQKNRASSNGYQKSRSMSTGTVYLSSEYSLVAHHPASTLLEFLQTFGPLIFPLHRAALLRKRILLVGEAPVEFACNIVYNLSVLSSLPKASLPSLPLDGSSSLKLRPLFNVGIHDIPTLEKPKSSHGAAFSDEAWVACTTDDVLSTKPELFDMVVFLPSANAKTATLKPYPRMVVSSPELARTYPKIGLRATQRDAQRYGNLRLGLKDFPRSTLEQAAPMEDAVDDAASTTSAATSVMSRREIVEPASWSQVAYTSLVWWASAGDRRAGLTETEEAEQERDMLLLGDDGEERRTKEVALVAYFHRLTSLIFSTASEAILRADGDDEDDAQDRYRDDESMDDPNGSETAHRQTNKSTSGDNEHENLLAQEHSDDHDVEITQEDMTAMGLDVWSAADRQFVAELIDLWWGRNTVVRGGTVECCGVRIL